MKKLIGCVKRADRTFNMIQEGDVIAVGLSGGKDSMLLLESLYKYKRFSKASFQLKAITIDMGLEGFDIEPLTGICKRLETELIIERTRIGKIIFEDRKEKNPCALCAVMRRGRLNKTCQKHGVNKLALGHHGDDLIETMMMSMIYESRMHTFQPVTFQDRTAITVIRPFIYAMESDITDTLQRHEIITSKNPCPVSDHTKRNHIKTILGHIECETPFAKQHIHSAIMAKLDKQI